MAWEDQDRVPTESRPVKAAWRERGEIKKKLHVIRNEGGDRVPLFNLFCDSGAVSGLGPAHFTKLLYFFHCKEPISLIN